MAEIHSRRIKEHKLDTVLAEDISFEGDVSFTRELMIKGNFKGQIKAGGDLYIGENAKVTAEIDVRSIQVRGLVKGNVLASSQVELMENAKVIGNITSPRIVMETGCCFEGVSRMMSQGNE